MCSVSPNFSNKMKSINMYTVIGPERTPWKMQGGAEISREDNSMSKGALRSTRVTPQDQDSSVSDAMRPSFLPVEILILENLVEAFQEVDLQKDGSRKVGC